VVAAFAFAAAAAAVAVAVAVAVIIAIGFAACCSFLFHLRAANLAVVGTYILIDFVCIDDVVFFHLVVL